jgi:hypothetical protein
MIDASQKEHTRPKSGGIQPFVPCAATIRVSYGRRTDPLWGPGEMPARTEKGQGERIVSALAIQVDMDGRQYASEIRINVNSHIW